MYPVDCERSEEHGSSAGGTPVAPAAVHGISVGVFIYVGRSSGPISCFFWGGLFFFLPSSLRGKIRAAAFVLLLFFVTAEQVVIFFSLYATQRQSWRVGFLSSMCIDVAESVEEIR